MYSAEVRLSSALQHFTILSSLLGFFFPIQKFYGYVEQIESWLSSKEAFLANEDLGVCALRNFLCNQSGGDGTVRSMCSESSCPLSPSEATALP